MSAGSPPVDIAVRSQDDAGVNTASRFFAHRAALLLWLLLTPVASADSRKATLNFGGRERTYIVHTPAEASGNVPLPLVLVFHGGGIGSAAQASRSYGYTELADAKHFIVVFPDGVDHHWHDGRTGSRFDGIKEIDDVGFVSALIDQIAAQQAIDPKRIFATGISNGGIFSYTLAARLSDRIAAIAPVAGNLAEPLAADFSLKQPVSVIAFNGTADTFVPYAGGDVKGKDHSGGTVLSAAATIALFVKADGCDSSSVRQDIPRHRLVDGTQVSRQVYAHGRNGTEVVLYTIEGGGHTWPGHKAGVLYGMIGGRTTEAVDATVTAWEFFAAHPKP